jgi:hypothetical protein
MVIHQNWVFDFWESRLRIIRIALITTRGLFLINIQHWSTLVLGGYYTHIQDFVIVEPSSFQKNWQVPTQVIPKLIPYLLDIIL